MLEAEGWVEFLPHKGALAASLSAAEVTDTFEIRFALESLALRKSLPILLAAAFQRAQEFLDQLDSERDAARWVDLNRDFHLCFHTCVGKRLLGAIRERYDAVRRYLVIELAALNSAAESQQEHRAILEACRACEAEAAVSLIGPHIVEAGQDLARALQRRCDDNP